MKDSRKKRGSRQLEILAVIVLLLITLFVLVILKRSVVDSYLKVFIVKAISFQLESEVTIDQLDISLFPPAVHARGVMLDKLYGGKSVFIAQDLEIRFSPFPIFLRRIVIPKLEITDLSLIASRKDLEKFGVGKPERKLKISKRFLNFQVEEIEITNFELSIMGPEYGFYSSLSKVEGSFKKEGKLTFQGKASLKAKGETIPVSDVRGELDFYGDGFEIGNLNFSNGRDFNLVLEGRVSPEMGINGTLKVDSAYLMSHFSKSKSASGIVSATFKVGGSFWNPRISGKVTAESLNIFDVPVKKIELPFKGIKSRILVNAGSFLLYGARGKLDGNLALTEKLASKIKFRFGDLELASLAKAFGRSGLDVNGKLSGALDFELLDIRKSFLKAEFSGSLNGLRACYERGNKSGCLPVSLGFEKPLDLKASIYNKKGERLVLKEFRAGNGSFELAAKGRIKEKAYLDYEIKSSKLDCLSLRGDKLAGVIDVIGTLGIDKKDIDTEGTLKIRNLKVGKRDLGRIRSDYRFQGSTFELMNFALLYRQGRVSAHTRIDLRDKLKLSLSLNFDNFEPDTLASLLSDEHGFLSNLHGRVSGDINVNGPIKNLTGFASLGVEEIRIYDSVIGKLNLKTNLVEGRVNVADFSVAKGSEQLIRGEGIYDVDGDSKLSFVGNSISIDLIDFLGVKKFFGEGIINFMTTYEKVAGKHDFRGELSLNDSLKGDEILAAKYSTNFEDLNLEGTYRKDQVIYKAKGLLKDKMPFSIGLSTKNFDFVPFLSKKVTLNVDEIKGKTILNATIEGNLKEVESLRGKVEIQDFTVWKDDITVQNSSPVIFNLRDGKYLVSPFGLSGTDTDLSFKGRGTLGGNNEISVKGYGNFNMLSIFFKEFARAEGRVDLDVTVQGSFEDVRVIGRGKLTNGLMAISDFPNVIQSINSDVTFSHKKLLFDNITGSIGGGSFRGSGTVEIGDFDGGLYFDAAVEMNKVSSLFPIEFPGVVSGTLTFKGPYYVPTLGGDLLVHKMKYSEPWDWRSKIVSFWIRDFYGGVDERPDVYFDIYLRAEGGNIELHNNVVDAVFKGDLHIVGDDRNVGLLGTINLVRGKVHFLDNEFDLSEANVRFIEANRVVAQLDVSGETTVNDAEIFLNLRGTSEKPEMVLDSRPPKSETDIVMLLTLGVESSELASGGGAQDGLSQSLVTSILSGAVQENIEKGLSKARLIDKFQVYPSFSEETRTTELRVVIGKEIPYDMDILYSTDVNNIGRNQEVRINKGITDSFSLQGTVKEKTEDRVDLGLDLEFKFDF